MIFISPPALDSITDEEFEQGKNAFVRELYRRGFSVIRPDKTLYKYAPLDTAHQILESQSFMFSSPSRFNDLLDMDVGMMNTSYTREIIEQWLSIAAPAKGVDPQPILARLMNDPVGSQQLFRGMIEQFRRAAGVTCFSLTHTSTPMWAHYADRNKGVCFGFKLWPMLADAVLIMLKVKYSAVRPRVNFFTDKPFAPIEWAFTKSSEWAYEQEVRAFLMDYNGLVPFEKSCLCEVHLGNAMDADARQTFTSKLKSLDYVPSTIGAMTIDFDSSTLVSSKIF